MEKRPLVIISIMKVKEEIRCWMATTVRVTFALNLGFLSFSVTW